MKKPVKQRNHIALALMARGGASCVHGKTRKAQRRNDKVSLSKGDY